MAPQHGYLQQYHDTLQKDMPNLRINVFINEDEDYYNLVVIIASIDPTNPLKVDPENPVQECFISNGCQSAQEALNDMPATDVIKYMNQPLKTGEWLQ